MPACHVTGQLHSLYLNKKSCNWKDRMTTGVSYMMPVMLCISKYMWLMFCFPVFILPGAYAKFRRATISFAMSVSPSAHMSVRMEQLDSHWTDFHEIPYLNIFPTYNQQIQIS
jgi:hypothetical protein